MIIKPFLSPLDEERLRAYLMVFYTRLTANAKSKKLAVIAAMRKMVFCELEYGLKIS
jgi:hypothetical protein